MDTETSPRLMHVLDYLNSPAGKQRSAQWLASNTKQNNENVKRWRAKRMARDPDFKRLVSWRNRISSALFKKWRRTGAVPRGRDTVIPALCGCSLQHLRDHVEGQFREGMEWANHGKKGWHLDHKKPVWEFDLSTEEGLKLCNHWTNLQPLWHYENRAKGVLEGRAARLARQAK